MEISSAIAAQVQQTRSELATNNIKQAAEADQQIAEVLDTAAASTSNVLSSPIRGTNVDISA